MAWNVTINNISLVEGNTTYDQGEATWPGFDEYLLKIVYLVLVVFWMVIGCIGNVLVMAAIATHKRLRTLANIFIVNLAIADIIVSSIINVFTIVSIMSDGKYWDARPMLCDVVGGTCVVVCVCSMYNIAAISVNRYIAICKNSCYHDIYTQRKTIMLAVLLWVLCILLDLPNFLGWGGHHYDRKTMICSYNHLADYSYTLFLVLMGLGLPMGVVIFCYIGLYLHVQQSRRNLAKFSGKNAIIYMKASKPSVHYPPKSPNLSKSTRVDKSMKVSDNSAAKKKGWGRMTHSDFRLLKTLFVIFIVFAFCWTPYGVIFLVDSKGQWPKPVYVMAIILAHLNSSMNSIIYGVMNRSFRQAYIALFRRCFCSRKYDDNYFGDKTGQIYSNNHYHSAANVNEIQMVQLSRKDKVQNTDTVNNYKSSQAKL